MKIPNGNLRHFLLERLLNFWNNKLKVLSRTQIIKECYVIKNVKLLTGFDHSVHSPLTLSTNTKHLLQIEPFTTPFAKLASDINNSGTIASSDIVALLRIMLGHVPNFNNGETWIVIPADTDFGPPTQHPPVITDVTISVQDILNGVRQPNWIAIKKGDANGSADPNN